MAIPAGVIFIWTGTNANIPAGWERETTLDGKFLKGNSSGVNAGVNGGNSNHSHTATNHSHTMNSHTHSVYVGDITTIYNRGGVDTIGSHAHGSFTSGTTIGGNLADVSGTYALTSNNPPYNEVIFIKPINNVGGLPENVIALYQDTDFVNNTGKHIGYYFADGSNGTTDLRNKYLRGAGAGQNAGATGGSYTNVHTLTHSHGSSTHYHGGFNTGNITPPKVTDTWGGSPYQAMRQQTHNHDIGITSTTDTPTDEPVLTTSETVEPLYRKKIAIQQKNTNLYTPAGIIGLWLGTLSSIPLNFEYCSCMDDYHLKIVNSLGEVNATGGSNTHSHTGNTHSHRSISHSHGSTQSGHPPDDGTGGNYPQSGGAILTCFGGNQSPHTITVYNETLSYSTATTNAASSNNEPEYRTVSFIKMKKKKGGAVAFL